MYGRQYQAAMVRTLEFKIKPNFSSNFELEIEAYLLPVLTTLTPNEDMSESWFKCVRNLQLADPNYNLKAGIDLVLGFKVFDEIVEPRIKKGDLLIAQKMKLS